MKFIKSAVTMRNKKIILFSILVTLLVSLATYGYAQEPFRVVDFTGEWEVMNRDHLKSKPSSGQTYIVIEEDNVVLGSWYTTIDLSLSGSQGDMIDAKYILEMPEIGFRITYIERYSPGGILDIGFYRYNELRIEMGGEVEYLKTDEARWPQDTRLNTRIFFGTWRIDKDNIVIEVTDYYGEINSNRSIYWSKKIPYNGESLSLIIKIEKNSGKDSVVEAYLYYNEVERDKIIGPDVEIRLLSIDSAALFYASLGFLIVAIVANFTSRTWRYYEAKLEAEKLAKKKETKKGKPSSRGK